MKIRVMGISTCNRCESLKEALNKSNIEHDFCDCDKFPDNCDALESLTGSHYYPMVVISDLEDNVMEVSFLCFDYQRLSESRVLQNGIALIPNHSIDGLLKYVINKLN